MDAQSTCEYLPPHFVVQMSDLHMCLVCFSCLIRSLNFTHSFDREELKIFSGEVVRFGNRCKDPQWHNLDRYFEK